MDQIEEMKKVNELQKKFYEKADSDTPSKQNSFITNVYRRIRRNIYGALRKAGVKEEVEQCHRRWCPDDISDNKVLDLGAGAGTDFGLELASRADEYIANDLSTRRLELLEDKLEARGIQKYRLVSEDFLESSFPEEGFDLVYARSALHHFEYTEEVLSLLRDRMSSESLLLTFDPIITWPPYRLFRRLYEPFQSDSAWEHPFTRSSLHSIEDLFKVKHVQGLLGRSKWAIPATLVSESFAISMAKKGHWYDRKHAKKNWGMSQLFTNCNVSFERRLIVRYEVIRECRAEAPG